MREAIEPSPASTLQTARDETMRRGQAVRRWSRNLPREHGFEPLEIEGELPKSLRGTLYRNGPGLLRRPGGSPYLHMFDGDGVVSAVRVDSGKAQGAVRIIQNEKLMEEQAQGRAIWGSGLTPATHWYRRVLGRGSKNVANTNVLMWQNRLLALFEGGSPTELSLADLSTIGQTDFGGVVRQMFSAHPHYNWKRRTTFNFGIRYGRFTKIDLFALPDQGAASWLASHQVADGTIMLHDFAVTEDYFVFFVAPARMNRVSLLLGLQSPLGTMKYVDSKPSEALVVPIDSPHQCTRFEVPAFFNFHITNAYQQGDRIIVDMPAFADFPYDGLRLSANGELQFRATGKLEQRRATIEVQSQSLSWETLANVAAELPTVPRSHVGKPYRYAYYLADEPNSRIPGHIGKLDVQSRTFHRVELSPDELPSEAIFVSRDGATEEDDGYLLSLIYDAASDRSYMGVFDARELSDRPLAKLWFNHMLPITLHGTFIPVW